MNINFINKHFFFHCIHSIYSRYLFKSWNHLGMCLVSLFLALLNITSTKSRHYGSQYDKAPLLCALLCACLSEQLHETHFANASNRIRFKCVHNHSNV
eukprot:SAG22_NODE_284_length_13033_cov_21.541828_7_plen_98_part_00